MTWHSQQCIHRPFLKCDPSTATFPILLACISTELIIPVFLRPEYTDNTMETSVIKGLEFLSGTISRETIIIIMKEHAIKEFNIKVMSIGTKLFVRKSPRVFNIKKG